MALTRKQETFVREYLVDLNATQAAKRAGYSEKTAGQQGEQLLKKLEIAEAVQSAMNERAERTKITADYVIEGISDIVERCARKGDEFNPSAALKGYELLGKHLKLFTDRIDIGVSDDVAAMIASARQRA